MIPLQSNYGFDKTITEIPQRSSMKVIDSLGDTMIPESIGIHCDTLTCSFATTSESAVCRGWYKLHYTKLWVQVVPSRRL